MSHVSRSFACGGLAIALVVALTSQLYSQTPEEYVGHVDACTSANVSGWALRKEKTTSVMSLSMARR